MSEYQPVRGTPRLEKIWSRGTEFLGSDLPIMCGAMTWISDLPEFARAVAEAGGLPTIALGLRDRNILDLPASTLRGMERVLYRSIQAIYMEVVFYPER